MMKQRYVLADGDLCVPPFIKDLSSWAMQPDTHIINRANVGRCPRCEIQTFEMAAT